MALSCGQCRAGSVVSHGPAEGVPVPAPAMFSPQGAVPRCRDEKPAKSAAENWLPSVSRAAFHLHPRQHDSTAARLAAMSTLEPLLSGRDPCGHMRQRTGQQGPLRHCPWSCPAARTRVAGPASGTRHPSRLWQTRPRGPCRQSIREGTPSTPEEKKCRPLNVWHAVGSVSDRGHWPAACFERSATTSVVTD